MSRQERLLAFGLFVIDASMLVTAFSCAFVWRYRGKFLNNPPSQPSQATVLFTALLLMLVLALFIANRCYDPETLFGGHREYAAMVKATTYAVCIVLILAFLANQPTSRGALILAWLLATAFVCLTRFLIRRIIFRLRESDHLVRRWLVVGTGAHAIDVARQLNWPASRGARVVGFLDDYRPVGSHVADGWRVLGDPRAVREVSEAYGVSRIVVVPNAISWESYRNLLELSTGRDGFRVVLAPGLQDLVTVGAEMTDSSFLPLIRLQPLRITGLDALMKRILDYLGSLPLLLILAPFAALCWLASLVDGDGPVFARRHVLGRQQERFTLVTFAAPTGPMPHRQLSRWAWRGRRTVAKRRLGKLPNVVNVIVGHMSLVGPRATPANGHAVAGRNEAVDEPWLRNIMRVRPGLTGPFVDSSRGEGAEAQALKDVGYVRDYSIWLDLRLLFASFKRALQRERSLPASYGLAGHQQTTDPILPTVVPRLP